MPCRPTLRGFVEHVQVDYLPHTVIIDCTAEAPVAAQLPRLAGARHPRRHAEQEGQQRRARLLRLAARRRGGPAARTTCTRRRSAPGLPVIQTLRDLRETGDEIDSIEGIFSGTLAYLFNVYDGSVPFSAIVREAKQRGYTEPDPRDDLSGMDVARKLIILGARDGAAPGDVRRARSRASCRGPGRAARSRSSWTGLPEYDADMQKRYEAAAARGQGAALRGPHHRRGRGHGGPGGARRAGTPSPTSRSPTTWCALRPRRYCDNPLIVQGPGAGPEVTAGGVFADLLRLSAYLGARL